MLEILHNYKLTKNTNLLVRVVGELLLRIGRGLRSRLSGVSSLWVGGLLGIHGWLWGVLLLGRILGLLWWVLGLLLLVLLRVLLQWLLLSAGLDAHINGLALSSHNSALVAPLGQETEGTAAARNDAGDDEHHYDHHNDDSNTGHPTEDFFQILVTYIA